MTSQEFAVDANTSKKGVGNSSDNFSHICKACGKGFRWSSSLHYHMKTHTGDKSHVCQDCNKGFPTASALKKHEKTHTGEKSVECPECGKWFVSNTSLAFHTAGVHNKEKNYYCDICPKGFLKERELRLHKEVHIKKPHQCQQCWICFVKEKHLQDHLIVHTDAAPHRCGQCGKGFLTKRRLRDHEASHSGAKRTLCNICGKGFTQRSSLYMHMVTHATESSFKCFLCDAVFKRPDNIKPHVRKEHAEKECTNLDSTYSCRLCSATFSTAVEVTEHLMNHSREKPKCHLCNKKCNDSSELETHMDEVHSKEAELKALAVLIETNDHVCFDCNEAFSTETGLKTHSRFLHKCEAYLCPICNVQYNYPDGLNEHLRNKHVDPAGGTVSEYYNKQPSKERTVSLVCPLCSGQCLTPKELMNHLLIHTKDQRLASRDMKRQTKPTSGEASEFAQPCTSFMHPYEHKALPVISAPIERKPPRTQPRQDMGALQTFTSSVCEPTDSTDIPATQNTEWPGPNLTEDTIKEEEAPIHLDTSVFLHDRILDIPNVQEEPQTISEQPDMSICLVCGESFLTELELISHTDKEHPSGPWPCPFCDSETDAVFTYTDRLKEHLRMFHVQDAKRELPDGLEIYICPTCSAPFYRSEELVCHAVSHSGSHENASDANPQGNRKIYSCGKPRAKRKKVKPSQLQSQEPTAENLVCSACHKQFTDINALREHEKVHLTESSCVVDKAAAEKKRHICPICKRELSSASKLKRHMLTHSGAREHNCPDCGKAFNNLYSLQNHIYTHRDNSEKPHKCKVCGLGCAQPNILKSHMKIHSVERPHRCTTCNEGFRDSSTLRKHEMIHTGERPYRCEGCGEGFWKRRRMEKHASECSAQESGGIHTCPVCSKVFKRLWLVKVHFIKAHPDMDYPKKPASSHAPAAPNVLGDASQTPTEKQSIAKGSNSQVQDQSTAVNGTPQIQDKPIVKGTSQIQDQPIVVKGTSQIQDKPIVVKGTSQFPDQPIIVKGTSEFQDQPIVIRGTSQTQDQPIVIRGTSQTQDQPIVIRGAPQPQSLAQTTEPGCNQIPPIVIQPYQEEIVLQETGGGD